MAHSGLSLGPVPYQGSRRRGQVPSWGQEGGDGMHRRAPAGVRV